MAGEHHALAVKLAGGAVVGDAPRFDRIHIADVDHMLTPRALGLVLSTAAPLSILGTRSDKPINRALAPFHMGHELHAFGEHGTPHSPPLFFRRSGRWLNGHVEPLRGGPFGQAEHFPNLDRRRLSHKPRD